MNVGKRLKEIREDKDIKQKTVAERLNVTPGHISNIENGKVSPSLKLFEDMLEIYGVKSYEVLEESPDYFYYVYGIKYEPGKGKGLSDEKQAVLKSILQQMPVLTHLDGVDLKLLDSYLKTKRAYLKAKGILR